VILRLKKLSIYGFKTFGRKTEIDFQDGITAIVGPNGAGKSNLIEALNWVTGETKMSDLRVKSAAELIFHGSATLKPLSYAEVSLTIENNENLLPIDYAEINITRRVNKDGSGEYYINKTRCTLKDINNLFIGTGVGKGSYSVMRQGEIGEILNKKPEERREMFERAAGILKYRNRKHETEIDLEKTEANLKQIRPTLIEVSRQLKNKQQQSEKAQKAQKLDEDKLAIEIDIHLIKLLSLKKNEGKFKESLQKQIEKKEETVKKLEKVEQDINESIDNREKMQSKKHLLETERIKADSKIDSLKQRLEVLAEKRIGIVKNIDNWGLSLKENSQKKESISTKIVELEKDKATTDEMIEENRVNLKRYSEDITNINVILQDNQESIKKLNLKIEITGKELFDKRAKLEDVINKLVSEIDSRKAELQGSSELKKDLKNKIITSLDELTVFLAGKRDILNDYLGSVTVSQSAIEDFINNLTVGMNERIKAVELLKEKFGEMDNLISGFDEIIFAREGIHAKKEELDTNIGNLMRDEKSYRERIIHLETDSENQRGRIETIKKIMHESQINLAKMREKNSGLSENIKTQIQFKDDIDRQCVSIENNIKSANEEISAIDTLINDEKGKLLEGDSKREQLTLDLKLVSDELTSISDVSNDKESRLRKYRLDLENIQDRIENINRDMTTSDVEIKNIYDNFYENQSLDLHEYEKNIENRTFDMVQLRTDLKKIKEELKELGSVNLMAMDEAKELKERHSLLQEQVEDIEKSKKNLMEIIEEINRNSEEVFYETFNKIKVNFHKIFRRLFSGGKGELELTNPDDVLNSGIEIFVQPPAKARQTVKLLSGGESSMTAIALLFAIFMVKPSPYCLLDEIDAALDGPNVSMFKFLLRDFRELTQFLVISHNINTLKVMDAIYGVYMESDGVSSALSLDINELEKNKDKYLKEKAKEE